MSREGHNFSDKEGHNNIWLTPHSALSPVRRYGPIGLDPCTESSNPAGASRFFTAADDGLVQSWVGYGTVFVNPPYSYTQEEKDEGSEPPIRLWARKIHAEAKLGVVIIALLPCGARFSTEYWQDHVLVQELTAVCFWRGRIPFIDGTTGKVGKGNNYDSMFYGFNVDAARFAEVFSQHGAVFEMQRRVSVLRQIRTAPWPRTGGG
jgi:phage N-6-adenine-methyltransferase